MVTGLKNVKYEDRLRLLGLPTLVYRRQCADMIQHFKIMHNYESVNFDNVSVNVSRTRGHLFKLQKNFTGSTFGLNQFSYRSVNLWNSLDQSKVNASSVNAFKSNLNTEWKNKDNKFYYE